MEFVKQASPHIRRGDSSSGMLIDVLIALAPVTIFALIFYTLAALRNILLCVGTMVLAEFIYVLIMNPFPKDGNKHPFKEVFLYKVKKYQLINYLAPTVSGLILALVLPCAYDYSYWAYITPIVASIFGLLIGKLVFGGTGQNIFNPAAVGMVFAKVCFGAHYRVANYESWISENISEVGATFLKMDFTQTSVLVNGVEVNLYDSYSLLDLFLGNTPGLMGETCKLAILIGFIYLVIRKAIDWRVTVSYLGSFAFYALLAGIIVQFSINSEINCFEFMMYHLLSGGLLFGAVFMATDPVTSPITRPSRYMYGVLLGSITILIRLFGSPIGDNEAYIHEGVVTSILIGNMVTPLLDYYKWSSNHFKKSNIIPLAVTPAVVSLIIIWACLHIAFNGEELGLVEIGPTIVNGSEKSLMANVIGGVSL